MSIVLGAAVATALGGKYDAFVAMFPPMLILAFFAGSFWQYCKDHPLEEAQDG